MHNTSARLVERVLPAASHRPCVLTMPFPLRLRIARDPGELSRGNRGQWSLPVSFARSCGSFERCVQNSNRVI